MDDPSPLAGLIGDDELAFLAGGDPGGAIPSPARLAAVLSDPATYARVLGGQGVQTRLSPRAVFAVVVYRAFAEIDVASFVPERVGPGARLPVFDVDPLRELGEDERRRVFLVDLLASFTRVGGGVRWVRTARGVRRRRWSELDPLTLVELLGATPQEARAPVLRRAGDVALFLSGVFAEATSRARHSPTEVARIAQAAGVPPTAAVEILGGEDGVVGLYEVVGTRWYREAAGRLRDRTLEAVADRFVAARRFLSYVSDRHLYRLSPEWLGGPGAR